MEPMPTHSRIVTSRRRPATAWLLLGCLLLAVACGNEDREPGPIDHSGPVAGWPQVGGNLAGQRYSPLGQINRENVAGLEEAWRFESGDVTPTTSLQVTPILVGDDLVLCTPRNQVVSLDAETGEEHWRFDAKPDLAGIYNPLCRGVAQARVDSESCPSRIYLGTLDARLIALDAETGRPCEEFGEQGEVDLLAGIGETRDGEYYMTSPPTVVAGRVVTGAWVTDGQRVDAPGGVIRGWDARTGALVWAWDPVPEGRDAVTAADVAAGAEYTRGTANAWSLLSADEELGLVFLPMGNAAPGSLRRRASTDSTPTRARSWRSMPGRASCAGISRPCITISGTTTSPRSPSSTPTPPARPVPRVRPSPRRRRWGTSSCSIAGPASRSSRSRSGRCRRAASRASPSRRPSPSRRGPRRCIRIRCPTRTSGGSRRSIARSVASSSRRSATRASSRRLPTRASIVFPGLGGGVNWGALSVDEGQGRLIVNSMRNPFIVQLVPREQASDLSGTDLVGAQPQEGTPYVTIRAPLLSSWGMPCTPPPWGQLTSIDLATGEIEWQRPLGNLRELAPAFGRFFEWGTPNQGGPIQTAGGLAFIAATMDRTFRAFDVETGEELWSALLPTSGHATPMTYRVRPDGRQFVVIAAGGHFPLGSPSDDVLVAYALPE